MFGKISTVRCERWPLVFLQAKRFRNEYGPDDVDSSLVALIRALGSRRRLCRCGSRLLCALLSN